MTEIIRPKEIIEILGITTANPRSTFNNLKTRDDDFPRYLYRDAKGLAYSRSEILEYFKLKNESPKKPSFLIL